MLAGNGYNRRTDIWSLGVIMYVIMLGQFPYVPAKSNANAMKAAILLGNPAPTFRPKVQIDLFNGQTVSASCKVLLKEILERDPARRPDADVVMKSPWFLPTCERSAVPLRPMLFSAKRVGAFDVGGDGGEDLLYEVLQDLQAQFHPPVKIDGQGAQDNIASSASASTGQKRAVSLASSLTTSASGAKVGESVDSTATGATACRHDDSVASQPVAA
jgi:serine/threonine protein kinase